MKTELDVTGMSCGHCVTAVRNAILGITGVAHADVSLADGRAIVEHDGSVTFEQISAAVSEEGYEVHQRNSS